MRSLDDEIQRVNERSRKMIGAYLELRDKIAFGDTYNTMYGDVFDYANFRIETAESCLDLIDKRKIADALGLGRSLLEHYLLLMLLCRGRKFFKLQNLESKTPEEFAKYFEEQQAALEEHRKQSDTGALYVAKYPRAKRHLMYVFEGLRDQNEEDFLIPAHYFQFQEFHPETMRLKDEDYFEYYKPDAEEMKARKDQRSDATFLYHHYLSYDALLQCLELNGLVDHAVLTRIEAHYTFLGRFLHPTHQAARNLHEHSNVYTGQTAIGMRQEYTEAAILLASVYVCFCLSGILDEVAGLLESAPAKYVQDPGTSDIRALTTSVPNDFSYFWFVFNGAPLYDRFNFAVHHVDDEALEQYGGYEGIPSELVTFDRDIYSHLQNAVGGGGNRRVGTYKSPLEN